MAYTAAREGGEGSSRPRKTETSRTAACGFTRCGGFGGVDDGALEFFSPHSPNLLAEKKVLFFAGRGKKIKRSSVRPRQRRFLLTCQPSTNYVAICGALAA